MFVTRSSTVGSKHHGETCFIPDAQLFIAFAGGTPLVDPSALGDAMGPGVALHQRKPVTAPSRRHGSQGLDFFFVRSSLPALSWPWFVLVCASPIHLCHPSVHPLAQVRVGTQSCQARGAETGLGWVELGSRRNLAVAARRRLH